MKIKQLISNTEAEYFLPKIVNDFVTLADSGKLTKTRFIDLISKKYSYKKQVLKYFSKCQRKNITSLSEAIDQLGIEECAFAIFNVSLFDHLKKNDLSEYLYMFEMQIFTAVSSYYVATEVKVRSPWKAYLAGLYSNVSYFFLKKYYPDEFKELMANMKNSIDRINYEWDTFEMTHSDISWLILGKAGIPEDIREAVKYHHTLNAVSADEDTFRTELSHSVYFGSLLTTLLFEDFSISLKFKQDLKKFLNIKEKQLDPMITELVTDFRNKLNLLDFKNSLLPGYFNIISKFSEELNELRKKLKAAKSDLNKEKKERVKSQKVLESYNKKLVGIAIKDPLTGIYNRRYLTERLNDEFIKAKKYNSSFVIITGDIDHFKKINDTYGHGYGDEVLVKIVELMQSAIRKADLLARVGGEEFVILCNQSNDYDGILIAEKVRKTIEKASFIYEENTKVPVTMSFGVAKFTKEIGSVQELLEVSDNRLYLAKKNGRNRVVYSDSTNEALM